MATTNGKWVDLGKAVVYDTNDQNVKRRDKNGQPYASGSGLLTLNGVTVKVTVMVRPGKRKDTQEVSFSMLVPETPATP